MNQLNQKKIIIAAIIGFLVLGTGVFAFIKFRGAGNNQTEQTTKRRKKVGIPENVIDVSERPYVKLTPQTDGRNIMIEISEVKKTANSVEYELEYQAGSLLQGAFGTLELGQLPVSKKVLFGSCSAGGACTYHEDVKGGSLRLTFSGGEDYAVKSDWNYQTLTGTKVVLTSKDDKFSLQPTSMRGGFGVVYNTPGYMDELPGELASDIYAVSTSSNASGVTTVTIESEGTQIIAFDGQKWTTLETIANAGSLTAKGQVAEAYATIR